MNETYFFDSYAIIEIQKGNQNYLKYLTSNIILTKLNVFEVYYSLLSNYGEGRADEFMEIFGETAKDIDLNVLTEAAKMKLKLNKRNISMTDCIGYCTAVKLGIKFLTGDIQFKEFYNVEFVK